MIKTQMNKYKLHRILLFLGFPTENETQCFSLWSKHNGNDSYSISRHFDKLNDSKHTLPSSFIGVNPCPSVFLGGNINWSQNV